MNAAIGPQDCDRRRTASGKSKRCRWIGWLEVECACASRVNDSVYVKIIGDHDDRARPGIQIAADKDLIAGQVDPPIDGGRFLVSLPDRYSLGRVFPEQVTRGIGPLNRHAQIDSTTECHQINIRPNRGDAIDAVE